MYGKSESQVTLASARDRDAGGGGKEEKVNIENVLCYWVMVVF